MYQQHKHFTLPDHNQVIWKYMDFTKLLSLLDKKSLFFCRVDKLGDRSEGIVPKATIDSWKRKIEEGKYPGTIKNLEDLIHTIHTRIRPKTFVNCWVISDVENYAMWKIYSKDKLGIAIQSTVGQLQDSIKATDENIYIGQVSYTNPENAELRLDNTFFTFLNKLTFYSFESELRLLIEDNDIIDPNDIASGKFIQIDIKSLIQKVYISSYAPPEFHKVIQLLMKEYNLDVEVCKSGVWDSSLT